MKELKSEFMVFPQRGLTLLIGLLIAITAIAFFTWLLDPAGRAAGLFLDRKGSLFPYPLTIQNFSHIAFCLGLSELVVRWRVARFERGLLQMRILPEDQETVLQARDLGPIRKRIAGQVNDTHGFLPYLLDLCILQFFSSRSVDQVVSVLNSSLELLNHRLDLRYTLARYLVWLIPTLGFIGTVMGIAGTLGMVPAGGDVELYALAQNLYVAFDTTVVGLLEAGILVFVLNQVQALEEGSLNGAGSYCLRNLVNRLYAVD